jgi:hypothetical protein
LEVPIVVDLAVGPNWLDVDEFALGKWRAPEKPKKPPKKKAGVS